MKGDERRGRPKISCADENMKKVRDLVLSDRRITTRMIGKDLRISKGSLQTIWKDDLHMRKLCAKIVPKVLTDEQKERRIACCEEWKNTKVASNFLPKVITGYESWIYEYDPETKTFSKFHKKFDVHSLLE